jgi:hypothetical protein
MGIGYLVRREAHGGGNGCHALIFFGIKII